MKQRFTHTFSTGQAASIFWVESENTISAILQQSKITFERPVIVVVGGASGIDEQDIQQLYTLFLQGIAPLAESLGAVVIDGGTDVGVMQMNGQAREHLHTTFPLIGVAAEGTVIVPTQPLPDLEDAAPLEPHHTHFFLVPGTHWGDEASWIAQIASQIAGNAPSVTLLVNGGNIAWQDVAESVKQSRPVLVVAGSGRTADILAQAMRGQATDERAKPLIASGFLYVVELDAGVDVFVETLKGLLEAS